LSKEAGSLVMPAADISEKQKDESDVAVGIPVGASLVVDTDTTKILDAGEVDELAIEEAEIKFAAELMKQ